MAEPAAAPDASIDDPESVFQVTAAIGYTFIQYLVILIKFSSTITPNCLIFLSLTSDLFIARLTIGHGLCHPFFIFYSLI